MVNSTWLYDHGVEPVIHKRRTMSGVHRRQWTKLVFNVDGIPLCECGKERPFSRWKGDGCVEDHRLRGHDKIELEVMLEMLVDLVNMLLKVEAEERCKTQVEGYLPIAA